MDGLLSITYYSARVAGERQNHDHTARFDVTDGFVGITQFEGDTETVTNRVLLSPTQWRALTRFLTHRSGLTWA